MFCSFTLLVCREKNILPNLTKSQEPEPVFFVPLELEPEPLMKKYQEPEPLGGKIRSRVAKKLAGSPALMPTTNLSF